MKKYKIKDEMFNHSLTLLVGCSEEGLQKWILKNYEVEIEVTNSNGKRFVLGNDKGYSEYFLWIEKFEWLIKEQALLIHEIQHHVTDVLMDIGIPLSEDTEEVYAYYIQSLVSEIWLALKPKPTKKKKNGKSKKQR